MWRADWSTQTPKHMEQTEGKTGRVEKREGEEEEEEGARSPKQSKQLSTELLCAQSP